MAKRKRQHRQAVANGHSAMSRTVFRTLPNGAPTPGKTPGTPQSKFPEACRKAGQLIENEEFAAAIALLEPLDPTKNRDAFALHLLGLAKVRNGQVQEGLSMIERSILASPDTGWMRVNRAAIWQGRGDHAKALDDLKEAVRLSPGVSEGWSNLAATQSALGDFAGAAFAAERAAKLNPRSAPALFAYGNTLNRAERYDAATAAFRSAIALTPTMLHAHVGLLQALQGTDDADGAAETTQQIARLLAAEAKDAPLRNANSAHLDQAIAQSLAQATASDAVSSQATVALALEATGLHEPAVNAADAAIALNPKDVHAHVARAIALLRLENHAAAIAAFKTVMALRPDWPEALGGLGLAYSLTGQADAAIDVLERAAALAPGSASIHACLASAHWEVGQMDAAEAGYKVAAQLQPTVGVYGMSLGIAQMRLQKFDEAAANYERRWETDGFADQLRPYGQPAWDGEDLAGKKILVSAEQGVGDEVMYAGMLQALVDRGAAVFFETNGRLFDLFERSLPSVIFGRSQNPPAPIFASDDFDYRLSAGSMLFQIAPDHGDLQPKTAYLRPDADLAARLRQKYRKPDSAGVTPNLVVGIAWKSGNPVTGRRRTAPLSLWAPILKTPGVRFVNLQYGDVGQEISEAEAAFDVKILQDDEIDADGSLDPFAAQLTALDLVVSADNSTVHFAGALGVPTLMLLNHEPDWRWFGADAPNCWYESVAHIRQETPGDWAPVMTAAADLVQTAEHGGAIPIGTAPLDAPMLNAGARPQALIVNDTTAWYHWGCTATSLAIRENVIAKGYDVAVTPIRAVYAARPAPTTMAELDDSAFLDRFVAANPSLARALAAADRIIINGEGTLHGLSENVRGLLYIAYAAAAHLGKPVQIINHSCYPEDAPTITDPVANALYRKVYGAIEYAAFREHITHGLMIKLGVQGALAFDSLPLTAKRLRPNLPSPQGKRLVIAGSASADERTAAAFASYARWASTQGWTTVLLTGARAFPAADENRFIQMLARHGLPAGTELAAATSLEAWMGEISRASLVATGRFHHSIAAFSLGRPFIAAGSNTAKVHALMQLLERPQPLPIQAPDLGDQLIAAHQAALDNGEAPAAHAARLEAVENLAMENFARL